MKYQWNENVYQMIKQNRNMVAGKDFATNNARLVFNDYHCLANPHLIKGSTEHIKWKEYFDTKFGSNCSFPFIVRLINSFMVTGNISRPN